MNTRKANLLIINIKIGTERTNYWLRTRNYGQTQDLNAKVHGFNIEQQSEISMGNKKFTIELKPKV